MYFKLIAIAIVFGPELRTMFYTNIRIRITISVPNHHFQTALEFLTANKPGKGVRIRKNYIPIARPISIYPYIMPLIISIVAVFFFFFKTVNRRGSIETIGTAASNVIVYSRV